jgi:hypothetical protein
VLLIIWFLIEAFNSAAAFKLWWLKAALTTLFFFTQKDKD